MKTRTLIAIAIIGMMTSCTENTTKMVIAHRVDGNDTTTLHKVKVDREFKAGEIVYPINLMNKFKIVRECRR